MHRSGMQHALRLGVVLAFCVLVVGAANVPLWVCVALIAVLVALSWAAPGLCATSGPSSPTRSSNTRTRHE
jgi:hypothetical protein